MLFNPTKDKIIHIETDEPLPMFIVKREQWSDMIGVSYILSQIERGFGNGYVCLPKWHPYFKVHYDNIPVNVHGGLTFSHYDEHENMWVIGFDTSHAGDSLTNCSFEYIKEQCIFLQKQCLNVEGISDTVKNIKRRVKIKRLKNIMKI